MLDARRRVAPVALIVVLAIVGCGDINPFEATSTTAPTRKRPSDVSDADIEFLVGMIEHLQVGQALTDAALDPSVDVTADVAALASHIRDDDAARVVRMTELLERWGEPVVQVSPAGTIPELVGLTGAGFDAQWKALMLDHHAQSVALAERVRMGGSSRVVDNLAAGMLIDLGFEMGRFEES